MKFVNNPVRQTQSLKKFIYLSISVAVATIFLKFYAWYITDSVGLLSDALESCVNLIASVVALILLTLAERPADKHHAFGHGKAEYFSSAIEGGLIMLAAFSIIKSAIPRIIKPEPLENIGIGVLFAFCATVLNLFVALVLLKHGKKSNSITLEADGRHLMTDVWTSAGVLIGIALVHITGWLVLDGIVAVGVAVNILFAGYHLIRRSAMGLLDTGVSEADLAKILETLKSLKAQNIEYHSLLTRQAGQRKFIELHVLVPGIWTIQEGHNIVEKIEKDIRGLFDAPVTVITHLEPIEDPVSMDDIGIDREDL